MHTLARLGTKRSLWRMVMQFESVSKNFLDHLQIERGLSANSISAYRRDLNNFGVYLSAKKLDFSKIDAELITAYEVSLRDAGLALSSINRAGSALKTFYKYLSREHGISDPTTEMTANRLPRKLPKALTIAEISLLIDSTQRIGDLSSLRDRAILEVLYGTGARVSEVVGINLSDLGKSTLSGDEITTLKLRGKGSKERIVPLGRFAQEAIENYLVRLRPAYLEKSKTGKTTSALFLNSRGSRLSRQSAWQTVIDAATATALTGKVSPHVFRHSYATHLLDGGADIRVVQELLGHSSVTTTQIYTLITIDKVREAYASAHPRAN
jgi:integrase/recombinase XerD